MIVKRSSHEVRLQAVEVSSTSVGGNGQGDNGVSVFRPVRIAMNYAPSRL